MWASRAAGRRGQGRVPAHSSACGGGSTHPGGAGGRADLNPIHPPTRETGGSRPRSRGKAQTWETGVRPPAPSTLGSRLPSPARRGGHRRAWHREGQRSCVSAACASFKCSVSHPSRKSRCAGRADPTLRPASPRTGNPTARLLLEQSGRRLLEWPFTAEENPSPRSQH